MGWTTVGNIKGPKGDKGDQGNPGDTGPAGTSVTIKGTVPTATSLPATAELGDGYITQDDGHLHVWGDTGFTDVGTVRGPQGPAGAAATLTVGTVSTGAAGSPATVTPVGTPQDRVFDFVIPQGVKGDAGNPGTPGAPGTAATVTVLSTSTGTPGSNATVTAGGTPQDVTLAFTIPQGAAGTPGADGSNGARGTAWFTGSGAPPASIPTSLPGDIYLDVDSGATYKLS